MDMPKTLAEARAVLEAHGYIPGVHNTKGITGEKRAQIKAACAILAAAPAELVDVAPVPVVPDEPQPRRPEDVPGHGLEGEQLAEFRKQRVLEQEREYELADGTRGTWGPAADPAAFEKAVDLYTERVREFAGLKPADLVLPDDPSHPRLDPDAPSDPSTWGTAKAAE